MTAMADVTRHICPGMHAWHAEPQGGLDLLKGAAASGALLVVGHWVLVARLSFPGGGAGQMILGGPLHQVKCAEVPTRWVVVWRCMS